MPIVVLVTTKDMNEAKEIVSALVEKKQIACANIIPSVESVFFWQEKVTKEKEVLIVMKSHQDKFASIQETVKSMHSYSVPEIIALPIIEGSADYLRWVEDAVLRGKK